MRTSIAFRRLVACQNHHLALAGLDIRRWSLFEKQGIDLAPTIPFRAVLAPRRSSGKRMTQVSWSRLKGLELQQERGRRNRAISAIPEIVLV